MELASRNIPFTIIEKNLPTPSEYDEIRSLTLNFNCHERLKELGVETSSSVIQSMTVLDGSGTGRLAFYCTRSKFRLFGSVLNFSELRDSLLAKRYQAQSLSNKEITSFHSTQSGITGIFK